jgi:hypothetical protein
MRRASITAIVVPLIALLLAAPAVAAQEQPGAPQLSRDEITAYARVELDITKVRDSVQAELAQSRNKTPEAQKALQEKLRTRIEEILHHAGMTEKEYQRRLYLVSTDPERRKAYEEVVGELTGQPTIAQLQANAAAATAAAAQRGGGGGRGGGRGAGRGGRGGRGGREGGGGQGGPVMTHLGHITTAFGDTPDGQGLLPVAMAEAEVVAQHAGLASRASGNLAGMKTHMGHILHALDPAEAERGPGQGYGVKKAANAIAQHIELAARAEGASQAVTQHATHVATSARNTAKRADEIIALAKQVQMATDAAAAATLVSQIASLAEQLIPGADANGDGQIGWQEGEGGLQHVEQHVNNILRAEGGGV